MASPKPRILCTEDDPDSRDLVALVLTNSGFDVICVDSAENAIELAKAQHFDLYLVDSWMPGLSGVELTKELRAFDKNTPILFYSAAAFEADKEAARVAGAQGYLVKPVFPEVLIDEVTRLVPAEPMARDVSRDEWP